jgi:hypothetical protein
MENAMIEERIDTIMVETAITKGSKEPKNTLVCCIAEAPYLAVSWLRLAGLGIHAKDS